MAAAKKTNWFAMIITAVVIVAVVGVGALVIKMNADAAAPAEAPASASVNQETGAIIVGDGPNVISEYVDFMCPFCGNYWDGYSSYVSDLVKSGDATLEIHPISILDNTSQGTQYSTRAANAAYCVANTSPEAAYSFIDLLYKNQPRESTPGLPDEDLIRYAEQVGATDVADCITSGTYSDYVAERTPETPIQPGATGISTPTIQVNDQFLTITNNPEADYTPLLTK